MKVLFLDIDGVINSDAYVKRYHDEHLREKGYNILVDPEAVELVRQLCEKEHVKIILSSSWRSFDLEHTLTYLREYPSLKPLLKYIIGITPGSLTRYRGKEIQDFLDNYKLCAKNGLIREKYKGEKIDKYAIVDDDSDMFENQKPFFVQTDWFIGITKEDIEKLTNILKDEN